MAEVNTEPVHISLSHNETDRLAAILEAFEENGELPQELWELYDALRS